MRRVNAKYTGQPGTFAQFGDSITDSRAFWTGLQYRRENASEAFQDAFRRVHSFMLPECWDRKGPEYGNQGGQTVRWADQNVDAWLERWNPQVAVIMFGTNDLNSVPLAEYTQKLRNVVRRCLENGTVVLLTTIPPRHGFFEKSQRYADSIRQVAAEFSVPLIDYHKEILNRRPDDWDGKLEQFSEFNGYDVPTLIARDGVHPSAPQEYRGDYSEQSLNRNGFALRNYLTLLRYAEVIDHLSLDDRNNDSGVIQ